MALAAFAAGLAWSSESSESELLAATEEVPAGCGGFGGGRLPPPCFEAPFLHDLREDFGAIAGDCRAMDNPESVCPSELMPQPSVSGATRLE